MKCISCEIEINPQWAHAIDINVCPFCGKHIMEEHLKNLFSTLRETMVKLSDYPSQLDDWMLSNYQYIKTDSPNIGKFMPAEMVKDLLKIDNEKEFQKKKDAQQFKVKVPTEDGGEEEVLAEKIQSDEETNDFHKRANNIKTNSRQQQGPNVFQSPAEKTKHLKELAQQIKKVGSQGITAGGGSMLLPAEMLDNADPEAVMEFEQMISGGGPIASSVDGDYDDMPGGDDILAANMAIAARRSGGGSGGDANPKDLAALQRLQSKVSSARRNMMTGESMGKGGFSRS